ncbi:Predicted metal-binding membrane protein [Pseudoalteromonas denitrificans DSM 6059]|uniref:Predicted metal-binding membrane protein n=2 Tax=Pseudoalteromonas TaxID=53246 RepID=A0A1I1KPA3_9GAMM|nr:Predicted metal-binding membrane protein [Pseudoalteromonas denitrificans DSM 6059]
MAPISHWSTLDILLLFIMWSIMMAGMMLPSALPVILLVEKINQNRKIRKAKYSHTLYFVLGYLLSWTLYSFIITLVQYGLHYLSILSPMMISAQKWFTCLLLFSAGVYQWLPIKQRCLKLCRSPLSFIITQWQEGTLNSIKIGFKHGQYCIGCCWVLMALLFVAGVMDLKWILALTVIVLIEKLAPYGAVFSKILGIGLILSCVFILVRFHYS